VITAADLAAADSPPSSGEIVVDAEVSTLNQAGETRVENITICKLIAGKVPHLDLEVSFTPLNVVELHNHGQLGVILSGLKHPLDSDSSHEEEEEEEEDVGDLSHDEIQKRFQALAASHNM
jgi:hypothetical protein